MYLTNIENDLRQPLFAVFAAPFTGLPYLIGHIFNLPISLQAILLNSVQIILLFTADVKLAKMMKLSSVNRIVFILLSTCTYTYLLFTLMMEQYIIAYFWLIYCIYSIIENRQPDTFSYTGATGTLLTSGALILFMSNSHPLKQFRSWINDLMRHLLCFLGTLLVFCRFDVLYNVMYQISNLKQFAGGNISFYDKFIQYSQFIITCFVAPKTFITTMNDHISWQLAPVTSINYLGIVVLILVCISFALTRKNRLSQISIFWIVLSFILLVILGWGTKENGLILYSLYFGWAFYVLLFQFLKYVFDHLHLSRIFPFACIVLCILLLSMNVSEIVKMFSFAIEYYPA